MATDQPLSTPPTTSPAGTRASVKKTSLKSLPPDIMRMGRTSTPGWRRSIRSSEMPLCFGASRLVRHSTKMWSATWPAEVHTFWPLTRHSSPSSTAVVDSPARSEPAPGSE